MRENEPGEIIMPKNLTTETSSVLQTLDASPVTKNLRTVG